MVKSGRGLYPGMNERGYLVMKIDSEFINEVLFHTAQNPQMFFWLTIRHPSDPHRNIQVDNPTYIPNKDVYIRLIVISIRDVHRTAKWLYPRDTSLGYLMASQYIPKGHCVSVGLGLNSHDFFSVIFSCSVNNYPSSIYQSTYQFHHATCTELDINGGE